ncbi:Ribonuclease H-like domain,DNA polymerase, palm domain [Cinara cedri]|uniref:Ribonuclease H-like domain,DNA polymerase, palm domain n=1 Tax=Cinara cedri TaxID=506608 RepID=A0A5E4NPI6_9HEMI|nr:Ribonuclease H-like domain,DNA polymerase, palm domain [Cinara cedri]
MFRPKTSRVSFSSLQRSMSGHLEVAVFKDFNIARHFNTKHSKTKYALMNNAEKKVNAENLKNTISTQRNVFIKQNTAQKASTLAEYVVAYKIAKNNKPYSEGEFVKDCMVSISKIVCPEKIKEFESVNSYISTAYGKRVSSANTMSAVRAKKVRMNIVQSPGFIEISSSTNRKIVWHYTKNTNNHQNFPDFLRSVKPALTNLLKTRVQLSPIKFNLKLEATYFQPLVENSSENRAFKTSAIEIFKESDIAEIIETSYMKLLSEEETYKSRGSGFTLESIDGLLLAVYRYTPLSVSSYIQLPSYLENKRATINPQNTDQQCFKWAILAKHVMGHSVHRLGENYFKHEDKYNFEDISFPTPLADISKFEKNNPDVSVNVYGIEKKCHPPRKYLSYEVFPLRVSVSEKVNHFDLLLTTNENGSHFIYISNMSRLIRSQKTSHTESIVFCKRCFTSFDDRRHKYKLSGMKALEQHKLICGTHKPILPVMPKDGDCVKFDAWGNTERHPFVIYADFEALLLKKDEEKGENTRIINNHEAMSYGFLVKASDEVPASLLNEHGIPTGPVIYRGNENKPNVAKHFLEKIVEVGKKIEKLLKTNVPMIMTEDEEKTFSECKECNLCKRAVEGVDKVRDYNHLTGKFRYTLCLGCNLKLQQPKFIPCYFHNLSNYDSHYIISELGFDTNTIYVIPNSEEKFISFSKYISNTFTIRFIDTFRFMASSLGKLASNLITPPLENFRETAKHFVTKDMKLVTRKGTYPYEYTDSWDKLNEDRLPMKRDFYSMLTESDITEEEYDHAKAVWDHFGCKTLGEYSDLYLKIDILLLADVFENFRDLCMKTYSLDAAHYYTAPGLSFHAMMKFTGKKLDLITDYDMLLMFENGIRGGLVQAGLRHAKANNEKTPDYDEKKDKSWLIYQDCNNLYGWAMAQYMPYGGFNWVKPDLDGLDALTNTSDKGRIYEVDVSYPQPLHDKHNDLPFLPHNGIPTGSKVKKLMATFEKKINYIIHYRNLQQAIANGLIVEKVHRVLEFDQSAWLKDYINLNTEMRKKASNDFEKDFFKLMNNAVFGKTMESKRKRMKKELVPNEERVQKLINKTTFKHATYYRENLIAVSLENKIIKFDKPLYIGKYTLKCKNILN